jgi:hypothetical protein
VFPVFGVPFFGAVGLAIFTRWRGRRIVIKKKESPLELHNTPLFAGNQWFQMLFLQTLGWLGATVVIWIMYALAQNLLSTWWSATGY